VDKLAQFDRLKSALAIATKVDEVKAIRDKAAALRAYCRQAKEGLPMQNKMAEIVIRAERRAGEILAASDKHKGGRTNRSHDGIGSPTFSELGIGHTEAFRWQKIASIDERSFEDHIEVNQNGKKELTTAGVLKLALEKKHMEQVEIQKARMEKATMFSPGSPCYKDLADVPKDFACLYADPPWQYGNQATRSSTDKNYPTLSIDDLCALPVSEHAAGNSQLHLWTTNSFIGEAIRLVSAWGFTYKTMMVWTKPKIGIGNYWRNAHELLLLGIRGSAPFKDHSIRSWQEHDVLEHSQKPELFRRLIEKVSGGPYLELFGRRPVDGWTVWGNEV
jgi:N6-adenosine-specific RNA methylase IME4